MKLTESLQYFRTAATESHEVNPEFMAEEAEIHEVNPNWSCSHEVNPNYMHAYTQAYTRAMALWLEPRCEALATKTRKFTEN